MAGALRLHRVLGQEEQVAVGLWFTLCLQRLGRCGEDNGWGIG